MSETVNLEELERLDGCADAMIEAAKARAALSVDGQWLNLAQCSFYDLAQTITAVSCDGRPAEGL